jgi:hypothetical protein
MAMALLILFTESLNVRFAVRIEGFLAALLPRRFKFGRCDVPVRPAFLEHRTQGLAYEAGAEALPLWEEIWPGPAMKLVGPLAARSPGLRLALALEIEGHCSADEILQGRLIDLVAFVDVDGAPGIPVEAGVE